MSPVLALDADGVLVDYVQGYAAAWKRAFGERPPLKDPQGYGPLDRWDVPWLAGQAHARFRAQFDAAFWRSLPAMPGAVQACHRLHAAGFDLVCVTAMDAAFEAARLECLRACGFPIERVVAVPHGEGPQSPKAAALEGLGACALVDDYAPYLRRLPPGVHPALIVRAGPGCPNVGQALAHAKSQHEDLAGFADYWIEAGQT